LIENGEAMEWIRLRISGLQKKIQVFVDLDIQLDSGKWHYYSSVGLMFI
jgi:hypothetical protein